MRANKTVPYLNERTRDIPGMRPACSSCALPMDALSRRLRFPGRSGLDVAVQFRGEKGGVEKVTMANMPVGCDSPYKEH